MKILVLIFLATSCAERAEFDPSTSPFADKPCDSCANHPGDVGEWVTVEPLAGERRFLRLRIISAMP